MNLREIQAPQGMMEINICISLEEPCLLKNPPKQNKILPNKTKVLPNPTSDAILENAAARDFMSNPTGCNLHSVEWDICI